MNTPTVSIAARSSVRLVAAISDIDSTATSASWEISKSSAFTTTVATATNGHFEPITYEIPTADATATFYVRVKVTDGTTDSDWATYATSTISTAPATPTLVRLDSTPQRIGVHASNHDGTDASLFQFDFATDSGFSTIVKTVTTSQPFYEYRVPSASRDATHYVRCKALRVEDFDPDTDDPVYRESDWSTTIQVDSAGKVADIDVESIAADKIDTGTMTANIVVSGRIVAGNAPDSGLGGYVDLNGNGIEWVPAGATNPSVVLPSVGEASFSGVSIVANKGLDATGATLRGSSSISDSATLTLSAGAPVDPTAQPTVASVWPTQLTHAVSGTIGGITWDSAASRFWVVSSLGAARSYQADGTADASFTIAGLGSLPTVVGVAVGTGDSSTSRLFILSRQGTTYYLSRHSKTDGSVLQSTSSSVSTYADDAYRPTIFYDATAGKVVLVTQNSTGTQRIYLRSYDPANLTATSTSSLLDSAFTGAFYFYGAARFTVSSVDYYAIAQSSSARGAGVFCFKVSDGTRASTLDFADSQGNAPDGGLAYDGTRFYSLPTSTSTTIQKHSTYHPGAASRNAYVRYTYSDGTYSTSVSPAANIALSARAYLSVVTPPRPVAATKTRVYVRGASSDSTANSNTYLKISSGAETDTKLTYGDADFTTGFDSNTTTIGPWSSATGTTAAIASAETLPGWTLYGNGTTKGILPSGLVSPFAGTTAPTGWLLCDGSAVSRTTYAALYAVIGTTYGVGDNSTTFNVPDLRQRFPLGKAASGTGATLGGTGGSINHTHSADHDHSNTLTANASDGTHTHNAGTLATASSASVVARGTNANDASGPNHTHNISGDTGTQGSGHGHAISGSVSSASVTSGTGNAPFISLNYIIRT